MSVQTFVYAGDRVSIKNRGEGKRSRDEEDVELKVAQFPLPFLSPTLKEHSLTMVTYARGSRVNPKVSNATKERREAKHRAHLREPSTGGEGEESDLRQGEASNGDQSNLQQRHPVRDGEQGRWEFGGVSHSREERGRGQGGRGWNEKKEGEASQIRSSTVRFSS